VAGVQFVQSAAPSIAINVFKTRNFVFFAAVLLMQWTLPRPAPADPIFLVVLYLSFLVNPVINSRFVIFFVLVMVWILSAFAASIHVMSDPVVQFQLLAHSLMIAVALTGCLVAVSWRESDFLTFMKVYLVGCCVAACLGIAGFAGGIDMFVWDGRASALFDEPIGFGAFLLPGVFASMYYLSRGEGRILPLMALGLCIIGVMLSFSRAAIFSLVVLTPIYFIILNRNNLARATGYMLIGLVVVVALFGLALLTSSDFQAKVMDRATIAKPYDVGQFGRYNRYLLILPMILENPLGLGMLEIDKIFPEPVHDIFLSSFINYGWLAGVAWILLTVLSFKLALANQRETDSPIALWLSFSVLAQLPCAVLQQVEHWRHFWLYLGLLWGFNIRNFAVAKPPITFDHAGAPPQWKMQQS
jgi:hypothetical protein